MVGSRTARSERTVRCCCWGYPNGAPDGCCCGWDSNWTCSGSVKNLHSLVSLLNTLRGNSCQWMGSSEMSIPPTGRLFPRGVVSPSSMFEDALGGELISILSSGAAALCCVPFGEDWKNIGDEDATGSSPRSRLDARGVACEPLCDWSSMALVGLLVGGFFWEALERAEEGVCEPLAGRPRRRLEAGDDMVNGFVTGRCRRVVVVWDRGGSLWKQNPRESWTSWRWTGHALQRAERVKCFRFGTACHWAYISHTDHMTRTACGSGLWLTRGSGGRTATSSAARRRTVPAFSRSS